VKQRAGEKAMAKMRAIEAAVQVMLKEGVTARSNTRRRDQSAVCRDAKNRRIDHVLARHVEGASHMAEGYTRAKAGQHRRVHRHVGTMRAPT